MRAPLVGVIAVVAAGVAGVAAGQVTEPSAQEGRAATVDLAGDRLVDLSHKFDRRTIYWPTAQRFRLIEVADGETEGGWHYAANNFEGAEHGVDHELQQQLRALEQHLALVREVPEERPLRDPGPLGDLRHGGPVVTALDVELHRGALEPAPCVRRPPSHGATVGRRRSDDSRRHRAYGHVIN